MFLSLLMSTWTTFCCGDGGAFEAAYGRFCGGTTGDWAEMLWLEPLLLCTREGPGTPCPAEARRAGIGGGRPARESEG